MYNFLPILDKICVPFGMQMPMRHTSVAHTRDDMAECQPIPGHFGPFLLASGGYFGFGLVLFKVS